MGGGVPFSASGVWSPPVELSVAEARFLARLRNGKRYAFLREVRHDLFDTDAQRPLIDRYPARSSGKEPVPPALLAMVLVLQGARHLSDEEAVERATSDRRGQLVLGTFDGDEEAPFTRSTLFASRQRLIRHELDVHRFDRVVPGRTPPPDAGERVRRPGVPRSVRAGGGAGVWDFAALQGVHPA
jgi:hypothetical protein